MEAGSQPYNTRALPSFDDSSIAERCARRIEAYWAGRGHVTVCCRVDTISGDGKGDVYVIRSNLVGGLPPARS